MNKSLKMNGILNVIKSLLKIVFPLVTYKHVSQILGVANLGAYNFSMSIVAYFSFIAALGVNAYAIRTGVNYRDKKDELEKFVSEIFSINLISTIISYLLLFLCLIFFSSLEKYIVIILIFSMQIFFTTIGIEWLYSIVEDYLYITVRTIVVQIASLVLLFWGVRTVEDTWKYAIITVIATAGSNVFNYFHAQRFCRVKLTYKVNIKKHLFPIMIIFAQNISVLIFVNSDLTILGLLSGDHAVGIYSVATNIYKGIKTVLSALIIVTIPRLSYYLSKNDNKGFARLLNKVFSTLMTFVFPIIVITLLFSKELVLFLSGTEFIEAYRAVQLLAIASLFSILSYVYGQCILIPMRMEKTLLFATVISALINIVLNFVFIPLWNHDGAAITTIISEVVVFAICWIRIHDRVRICHGYEEIIKPVIGCLVMGIICVCLKSYTSTGGLFNLLLCVFLSMIIYFCTEYLLKNKIILHSVNEIVRKIKNK